MEEIKKSVSVSILCTGTELTNGLYVNTNAKELAAALYKENFNIVYHLCIPDGKQAILDAFDFCSKKSDLIITTGGLGPTEDDLTKDALAQYLRKELLLHAQSQVHIQNRHRLFNIPYYDSSVKMAHFPEGAIVHVNHFGSANGCTLEEHGKTYCVLPGPPKECLEMFFRDVLPYLIHKFKNPTLMKKSWKMIGLIESAVDFLFKDLSHFTQYSICWRYPYVEVSIAWHEQDNARVQEQLNILQPQLNEHSLSEIDEPYFQYLNKILEQPQTGLDLDFKIYSTSPIIMSLFHKLTTNEKTKRNINVEYEVEYKNDNKDGLIKINFDEKSTLSMPFRNGQYEPFLKEWIALQILRILLQNRNRF